MPVIAIVSFICCMVAIGILLFVAAEHKYFIRLLGHALNGTFDASEVEMERLYQYLDAEEKQILQKLSMDSVKLSKADLLTKEAELHALQNQINPHFLYNTLEVIRSSALKQQNDEVATMVEALALQFRYCINHSGETATLRQELDHIKNYLLIQRYRLGDRFQYREFIDDPQNKALNSLLPKLTLQPLIENGLMHGINPKIEGGIITVRIRVIGKRMHISVEDDGIGMSPAVLQTMRKRIHEGMGSDTRQHGISSNGMALRNVNERIKLYFGDLYGLDISSTEDVGTSVFINLPLVFFDEAL